MPVFVVKHFSSHVTDASVSNTTTPSAGNTVLKTCFLVYLLRVRCTLHHHSYV